MVATVELACHHYVYIDCLWFVEILVMGILVGVMNTRYDKSVFEAWPEVKADMLIQLKAKLESNTLSYEGILHAQSLIQELEKS